MAARLNYRHAFHAGNPSDCAKHALVLWIAGAMLRKPAPLFVLDTHAGVGLYRLEDGPAARTGEWRTGIARLLDDPPPALADYVSRVRAAGPGMYPGSPLLLADVLRDGDRMACCELHPEDAAALRQLFRGDKRVGVHARDGWAAVRGLLPPGQGRALVLIDPPFEQPGEHERVVTALRDAAGRMGHAVVAAWYPIKHRSPVTALHEGVRLAGLRDVVAAELWWRSATDPARLNGCGLLVRHPPWGFEAAAADMLGALAGRLGEAGAGQQVLRVIDE